MLLLDPGSLIDSSNIGMNVFLFIFGKILFIFMSFGVVQAFFFPSRIVISCKII